MDSDSKDKKELVKCILLLPERGLKKAQGSVNMDYALGRGRNRTGMK